MAVALIAAVLATIRPALADQQYDVRGDDVYHVGSSQTASRVAYTGEQRLTVGHQNGRTRYDAQATYTRDGEDGTTHVNARFVQELLPNGSFEDRIDDDPDFLTILNQPFAVQLDPATLRDLRGLRGEVPFSATSPLGGEAVLHGHLHPGAGGKVDGRPTVAVAFEAQGPMSASMPDRAGSRMSGHIRMDGTAYYSLDDAMLLALNATLTIVAKLHDAAKTVPVRIIYRRYIRASSTTAVPNPVKTLPPTPLATGGGTVSPAFP